MQSAPSRRASTGIGRPGVGNQSVEEVDVDVAVGAHRGGDADEHRGDQQVACDLLGPRRRVVEEIAGENW